MTKFSGFGQETTNFLAELAANNNREWFGDNKHRYESCVVDPAFDFILQMGEEISSISTHFEAIPKKQGGSLMRVYRDTRFGKDKTPYKTNIGIQFRHEAGKDVHAPGFYVHIEPDNIFVGLGMWRPEPGALRAIRERIAERPDEWLKITGAKGFKSRFALGGESLKRPPKGFDPASKVIEELKRKDFIAVMTLDGKVAADPKFPSLLAKDFRQGKDFLAFLCKAVGVPF